MSRLGRTLVVCTLLLSVIAGAAEAWIRIPALRFATLPEDAANPEGITVDADGNVYVTTFSPTKPVTTPGEMLVFDHRGKLLRRVSIAGSSPRLLDLAFHPTTGALLVIDFGNARVLQVDRFTGASTLFTQLPASAGPNVLTFDDDGRVYISDSFGATIWRTGEAGGAAVAWKTDPLLGTTGVPPFGANGLAFNTARSLLFVANTGNDSIVQIQVLPGFVAGEATVFTNSINGADGLIIDDDDNLWVAANQADEIVVVNPEGRVIAKLGDFGGLDHQGRPINLLFPASLVRHRGFIYVTNLALDLRLFGSNTVDAQWAADVKRHTISRIPAIIPPVRGLTSDVRDDDE
jgi:sugar lactone lactonase YvrE